MSQESTNLENEQNIDSSLYYPTSVYNDKFHMSQCVAATSSDHYMVDESHLWGSLWNLDKDNPHGFGGGIEAPSCGSGDYSYNGFYTGGYIF